MSKRFLIGQLACFGDCLYATTIAKQIKSDYPESHVTWAVAKKYKSILELNPYIDVIWEIPITDGDYCNQGWRRFEIEALNEKSKGRFDEIIFSQVHWKNFDKFYTTLRKTALSSYYNEITVSPKPVLCLSDNEIKKVSLFAKKNELQKFKYVFLFECEPGSNQSKVNPEFALTIAKEITSYRKDVCFILSTPRKLNYSSPQILDASELTFRENAELTKYCTLLIGCSSGITWLSTSDWAKQLPLMQLLDRSSSIFAGVHFDFEVNRMDTSEVLELLDYDIQKVTKCLELYLAEGFINAKIKYHDNYKPSFQNLRASQNVLLYLNHSIPSIIRFTKNYTRENKNYNNIIPVNYTFLVTYLLFSKAYIIKSKFLKRTKKLLSIQNG